MPSKYRTKRPAKRYPKRKDKKTYKNRPTQSLIRAPTAVPDQCLVKMKYCIGNTSIASVATPGVHIFSGNSIFDPDVTAVGHQPLGRDEWGAFYDSYLVYGLAWDLTFVGDNNNVCNVSTVCKPTNTTIANYDTVRERPYAQTATTGLQGSNKHIMKLKGYMSTNKIFGVNDIQAKNSDYTAGWDNNPVHRWYLHLYTIAFDRATSVTVNVDGDLYYYVKMFDRKALQRS